MWLIKCILFNLIIIQVIIALEVGDECKPNNEIKKGVCKLSFDCKDAISYIQTVAHHPYSRCGFNGITEIVCCPITKSDIPITTKKPPETKQKFGETNTGPLRVADIECQKIVKTTLAPLGLHIIGGERAGLGEYPHMASLGYERSDGYDFLCGGSLISANFILTAAHCVDTLDQVTPSIARLGVIDIEDRNINPETDYKIVEIIKHPEYKRRTKYHDLSLLRLENPVEYSTNLSPICLYTSNEDPKKPLAITGWGKTSTTRDIKSNVLLTANVTIVPKSACGKQYTNWRKLPAGITDDQVCAGDPLGLRDTCQGDSGGPLQGLTANDGHYRLVGVTSFGRGCGSPGVPGVYTRISRYLAWLEAVVWPQP